MKDYIFDDNTLKEVKLTIAELTAIATLISGSKKEVPLGIIDSLDIKVHDVLMFYFRRKNCSHCGGTGHYENNGFTHTCRWCNSRGEE